MQVANRPPQVAIPMRGYQPVIFNIGVSKMYLSGLQYRFSVILSVFLLTLIAVPLSYVAPRHGRYLKLIPALLIYLLYIGLVYLINLGLCAQLIPHGFIVLAASWFIAHRIALHRYGMGPFRAQLATIRFKEDFE